MKKEFTIIIIIIEQDEDGIYIGSSPELPGCHAQASSLDELNKRIIEVIELYLETDVIDLDKLNKFIGIQKVEISFKEA